MAKCLGILLWDDVDENELLRLSIENEKQYYGYISDEELIQAMSDFAAEISSSSQDLMRNASIPHQDSSKPSPNTDFQMDVDKVCDEHP